MQKKIESEVLGVLVLMPVYNHEKYIRQAIEGVLFQKTNFPVLLYISDDASTDNSFELIKDFSSQNKIEIVSKRQVQNLGASGNGAYLRKVVLDSKFKYISILEGDDYWTDPTKLQKQFDYLEANNECFITSHNVWVNYEDSNGLIVNSVEWLGRNRKPINTVKDIIRYGSGGATCSLVFRSSVFPLPSIFSTFSGADVALQMLLTSKGYMYYFKEPMGVYRKNAGSVTLKKNIVKVYRDLGLRPHIAMKKLLGKKYYEDFDFHIYDYYLPNLMIATKQEKKHFQFLQYWIWHQWLKFRFRVKKM